MLVETSADVYFKEADELLSKGDTIQASEKYYKAAEEAIKLLSILNGFEVREWNGKAINESVIKLSEKLGNWVISAWGSAVALLTANLSVELMREYREEILRLVKIADEGVNSKLFSRS